MGGGLTGQKILRVDSITQNAAFAIVIFLGADAMKTSTIAPTAGRVWMEVKIVRLVDLDAVIDCLEVEWGYEGIREDLYSLPVVDAVPVVHGEWLRADDDWNSLTTIQCSLCGEEWCFETDDDVSLLNYKYCPNCGAKMDGGNDDAVD